MAKAAYIGKKQGGVDLDPAVFGEEFHEHLVHEAARAELNARRRGTASTRTRGEIAMTGAKAWRQKGTGRARVGALSVPHRTGGGVAFGPKPRDYTVKVNRKARRKALRAALSVHAGRGSIGAVDAGAFEAPSTKQAAQALAGFADGGRALIVLVEGEDAAAKSFRNIADVGAVLLAEDVGVADLLGAHRVVASEAGLEQLTARAK